MTEFYKQIVDGPACYPVRCSGNVRLQATVRKPLASEIKRLADKEGRTESEMAAQLLDEAVRERAAKGLAQAV